MPITDGNLSLGSGFAELGYSGDIERRRQAAGDVPPGPLSDRPDQLVRFSMLTWPFASMKNPLAKERLEMQSCRAAGKACRR